MNNFQRHTINGKPLVNNLGLPVFNLPVQQRIKNLKKVLGLNSSRSNEQRWNLIQYETNKLII